MVVCVVVTQHLTGVIDLFHSRDLGWIQTRFSAFSIHLNGGYCILAAEVRDAFSAKRQTALVEKVDSQSDR